MNDTAWVIPILIAVVTMVILPVVTVSMLSGNRRRQDEILGRLSALARAIERLKDAIVRESEAVPAEETEAAEARPPAAPPVAKAPETPPVVVSAARAAEPEKRPVMPPPIPAFIPPPPVPAVEIRPSETAWAEEPVPEEEPIDERQTELEEAPAWMEYSRDVLRKIWNWILVGEEHRPANMTAEYAIASTWLLRVGIVAIVLCGGYFLKWSIEKNLISNVGRVAICIFAGLAMLVAGVRMTGRKYHLIGQGFLGGGLLLLYFSMYATGPMYHLMSMVAVFGLMILVTVAAGVLAVRMNSLLTAIIGIAGAFATPVMLRTGVVNFPGLYSYMLLISLGILAVAYFKQWRLLNYLGFIATYVLLIRALDLDYQEDRDFGITMWFLGAFFVIHSAIVYLHNIAKGEKSTVLELIHLVLNAVMYSGIAYVLIDRAHGRPYPGIMSVSVAVFYMLHVWVFLKKQLRDRPLLMTLIALAGLFTAWTLPLLFENEMLTISFALLALMFLWLGQRLDCNFMVNLAHVAYAVVFFRLVFLDLHEQFGHHGVSTAALAEYWKDMAHRLWSFGISIASIAGGAWLQRRRPAAGGQWSVSKENDMSRAVPSSVAGGIFYWFGVLFAFLFIQLEFNVMFGHFPAFRLPVLTALWCVMAGYFLWKYLAAETETPDRVAFAAMCFFIIAAVLKLIGMDLASWQFNERFVYNMEYDMLHIGARGIDFAVVLVFLAAAWWLVGARKSSWNAAAAFGYMALFVLFVYATLELNTLLFFKRPDFQKAGVSILWALFAAGFVSGGIWKNVKALRHVGLLLFVVVVAKIAVHDLNQMAVIYRVMAFMVLGVTLILGSFAYIYSSKKFLRVPSGSGESPVPGGEGKEKTE